MKHRMIHPDQPGDPLWIPAIDAPGWINKGWVIQELTVAPPVNLRQAQLPSLPVVSPETPRVAPVTQPVVKPADEAIAVTVTETKPDGTDAKPAKSK